MSTINFSVLKDVEWIDIPGVNFLIKNKFFEKGYSVLVTNLKEIFGEMIDEKGIQNRFSDLNVHAKMKTSVITRNLKEALGASLTNSSSCLKVDCYEKSMRIQVQFNVNSLSLIFFLEPHILPSDQLQSHILIPILSHALLTYQENMALKKKLSQLENKMKDEPRNRNQESLLDYNKNLNAFTLMKNENVSEAVVIDSFLSSQKDMEACFDGRKKVLELHQKIPEHLEKKLPQLPVKKEISEPSLPIRYGESEEDHLSSSNLPVKREISESLSEDQNYIGNNEQLSSQAPSSSKPNKIRKKKCLKF